MTTTPSQLACLLADAEKAYHQLITGTMPRVVVDQNGERVEFTAANRQDLAAYIQTLRSQCAPAGGFAMPSNGPAQFYF